MPAPHPAEFRRRAVAHYTATKMSGIQHYNHILQLMMILADSLAMAIVVELPLVAAFVRG
jgi:hypothetical protein